MDALTRSHYEMSFTVAYVTKRGDAFQDFFSSIMEKCHPTDFIRVRPWGSVGDRKNDGFLRSERRLFQVYAPNEMESAKAITKIDEDFKGALPHWKTHFDNWSFVHNSMQGLGPEITKKLLDLAVDHAPMNVNHWGFEELRQRTFRLKQVDLASLLGQAPSKNDVINVGHEQLHKVLHSISRRTVDLEQDYRPVSPHKIAANGLSESVTILLTAGMMKSDLVEEFFDNYFDPTLGDEIVNSFKQKYEELKTVHSDPDLIFGDLHVFAGGGQQGTPSHEAAVYAILAFLFEQCDIFERPKSEAGQ